MSLEGRAIGPPLENGVEESLLFAIWQSRRTECHARQQVGKEFYTAAGHPK
jgi:hypothetical protein